MAGVGVAFDFGAGTVKQARAWMLENRAQVVLPPRSRVAPALAMLPRHWIKIRGERLFS